MPLCVLHVAEDAMPEAMLHVLVKRVSDLFLEAQGALSVIDEHGKAQFSEIARSICRVEVDLQPRTRVFVGGQLREGPPLYRFEFWTPEGALTQEKRDALYAGVTDACLECEGVDPALDDNRYRVWCVVNAVASGSWGCAGRAYDWGAIKRWVCKRELMARRLLRPKRALAMSGGA